MDKRKLVSSFRRRNRAGPRRAQGWRFIIRAQGVGEVRHRRDLRGARAFVGEQMRHRIGQRNRRGAPCRNSGTASRSSRTC